MFNSTANVCDKKTTAFFRDASRPSSGSAVSATRASIPNVPWEELQQRARNRIRNSIDSFLIDPTPGSHHLRHATFRNQQFLTPFNIKELLLKVFIFHALVFVFMV